MFGHSLFLLSGRRWDEVSFNYDGYQDNTWGKYDYSKRNILS